MSNAAATIHWDSGTAYDFFISCYVLHNPDQFSLRGAWAAGVRSRLPSEARETMELAASLVILPFAWIYGLPQPHDGRTILRELAALEPVERVKSLTYNPYSPYQAGTTEIMARVMAAGQWNEADLKELQADRSRQGGWFKRDLKLLLSCWAEPEPFADRYLQGLGAYHGTFFAEEEKRIAPALQAALDHACRLAAELPVTALLEELSQGVRYTDEPRLAELVLAPSFWITPLLIRSYVGVNRELFLFGGRPANASLVPGELVPDALFQSLKALADPTRLRILRYLTQEPLTPSELAQRLRLRAPTVIHHLHALRLAGLVYLSFEAKEKRYTARSQAVEATFSALSQFLAET
jgi:DNA-binding transcriptional ArsR family regulator